MYKTAISLEFATRRERDTFLKALQGLFFGLGYATKGKVRVSAEVELDTMGYLPLFAFGIEQPEPTPIEQASYASEAAERVADEEAAQEDEPAEKETPEAEAPADDDEPRTPFDRLLGRELPSDESE